MLESFASPEEIDAMMKRMEQLLHEFDCSSTSIFSTKNQVLYSILINQFHNFEFFFWLYELNNSKPFFWVLLFQQQSTDNYFFESAENVSFFFEGMYVVGLLIFSFCVYWLVAFWGGKEYMWLTRISLLRIYGRLKFWD